MDVCMEPFFVRLQFRLTMNILYFQVEFGVEFVDKGTKF